MGKPVKMIKAVTSGTKTVAIGTVGTIEAYPGQDNSAMASHPDIECNAVKIVFLNPAVTISLPIDKLKDFIVDVPIDTPPTPL